MIDSEFDDFAKGKLGDHEVPVPAGLWNKVADGQFDQFIGSKLKDTEAPVPAGLWDRIADAQFDSFVGNALVDHEAPVPAGLFDRISDTQFDNFVGSRLADHIAPVPAGAWDRIADGQFDRFVSDKLYNYEAPVPAGLWEKIKPEEDDDHGGLVWFRSPGRAAALVLLMIGLLGGGYFWYRHTTDNPAAADGQQTTAPLKANRGLNPSGNTTANPAAPDAGIQPDQNASDPNAANKNSAPGEQTPASNGLTDQSPANRNGQADPAGSTATVRSGNRRGDRGGETIFSGNIPANNGGNLMNGAVSRHSRKELRADQPRTNGKQDDQTAVNTNTGLLAPVPETDNFGFIEPYQQNHLHPGSTIPTDLTGSEASFNMLDKKAVAHHYGQFKSVIICPSDKNRNTDWFLEAYASPDFAFRSLTNNTASQAYLLRKDSSESMRIGYTAGIRLVKPINDNILVKAGVQYTQMNQKYVYRTENEVKTITVVSTRTIIRAPGDTVIVRDTSVLQQIGFKNNTVINRFRSIDVPVMLGYQFGNEDLKIGVNAGVVINMSSWYQGVMLDSTLATVPITKGSPNMIYKNKLGLGIVGSISLVKKLGEDLHIFAEPYFRYNLSNMTTPNAPYNQKFSLGGIAVGVRLNLNRQ